MKKLAFSALLIGALGLVACGGDDGDDNGGTPDSDIVVDDGGVDSDATSAACSPTEQTGCDVGEKCAQLVTSDDDPDTEPVEPFLARTACVPDGEVPAGEACTQGEPGEDTGFDDCVAGTACNGVCVALCNVEEQTGCTEDEACVLYSETFEDVGNVGLCAPACDVVTQTMLEGGEGGATPCPNDGGCYLNTGLGITSCATVPGPAADATHDKVCYGPAPGSCYLNGCAAGYMPFWLETPGDPNSETLCAAFCGHQDTYLEGGTLTGNAQGDPATVQCAGDVVAGGNGGPYTCRSIQGIYQDETVPNNGWGICASAPLDLGDCTQWEKNDYVAGVSTDGAFDVDKYNVYCAKPDPDSDICAADPNDPDCPQVLDTAKCPSGCISEDTWLTWFTAASARLVPKELFAPSFTDAGRVRFEGVMIEAKR